MAIGESLPFSFAMHVRTEARLQDSAGIQGDVCQARGKVGSKVFQITENTYKPGEHTFSCKHAFADLSTRKHYPGSHDIAIIVNGVEKAKHAFRLASP